MSNIAQLFPDMPVGAPQARAQRFEEFWLAYPRKVGKPLAKAKYEAIVSGGFKTKTRDKDSGCYVDIELAATEEELIEGAKAYARSQIDMNTFKIKDGGRYTLFPATWLNSGRFLDEIG